MTIASLLVLTAACGQLPAGATRSVASPSAAAATAAESATPVKKQPPAPARSFVKHADLINGVSCIGPACTAVGYYYYGTSSENTLVERWNGSAWQLVPSPDPARFSLLLGVSCPASNTCVAVGSPALRWSGGTWQLMARTTPFASVACAGQRFCLAVGENGTGEPVYGTWRGTAWHTSLLPAPQQSATSPVTIAGVSCVSASFCLAVGNEASGMTAQPSPANRDRTLALEWDGRTWRRSPTPNVGKLDQFTAASCYSASNCTAVGTTAGQYPIAEQWNGTTWRVQHISLPGKIGYTQLRAISCPDASTCVAIGSYQGLPLAETRDGGTWRLAWLPHPAGDDDPPQSVSCAAATTCMAVGNDFTGATSYAERWNGTSWQLLTMANPR
jgi:hypothetical protein